MHLLALLLCIYSVSATWQKLYNCNQHIATVFPVPKNSIRYGPKQHKPWGKWWKDTQAKLPLCQAKVDQAYFAAYMTTPKDPAAAMKAYNQLKDQIYAREKLPQKQVSPTEFEEKIRLEVFASILGWEVVAESFPFIESQYPIHWLNPDYKLFLNWENLLLKYYERATRLRLIKADYFDKDFCSELADNMKKYPDDWALGTAKDAFNLVFRCFDTFPYSAEAINELLSGALMLNDLFVFTNMSAPYIGATKFFSFLKDQQVVFDSHYRWHEFLPKALNAFKDAHVSVKNDCYESFTYIQPIFLQKILRDGLESYIITKANSVGLMDFVNAEVIAIDGDYADYVIDTFATTTGKCHDSRARSAFALSRKQWTGQDFVLERGFYLKRTLLPPRPYVVYTLAKPDSNFFYEIKIDWLIFKGDTLNGFDDQYTYWKNNCAAKPFVRKISPYLSPPPPVNPPPPPPPSTALKKRTIPTSSIDPSTPSLGKRDVTYLPTKEGVTPVAVGPGFAFFTFVDDILGAFGVLVIHSFDVGDKEGWHRAMRTGFQNLMQAGIKNLLLDLSGNTGGVLCLAYSLLGVLSPSPTYPFPATKYSYGTRVNPSQALITLSKCVDEANIKGSAFKLQTFKNLTCNCDFAPDLDWNVEVDNEVNLVNGFLHSYSKYSTFLVDSCQSKYSPLLEDLKPDFENIVVLSDGLCGSSCAIVSLYLQQNGSPGIAISSAYSLALMELQNITTVYPMGLFAFAGGQVVSYDNLKDIAKYSSCYDTAPKLLERIQITFTYRAIFNLQDKKNPLEYYLIPANATIPYNEEFTNSVSARWKSAFPLGMDVLKNPDNYQRFESTLITSSLKFSYVDMNNY